MLEKSFQFPIRVYYEDTDAGGVVYHARYLHFFERARTEFLRAVGFSQQNLLQDYQFAFVVKNMNIEYCLPARLDDLLIVETQITQLKGATIIFSQQLKRDELILSQAQVKIAGVNLEKMKAVPLPAEVKQQLANLIYN